MRKILKHGIDSKTDLYNVKIIFQMVNNNNDDNDNNKLAM